MKFVDKLFGTKYENKLASNEYIIAVNIIDLFLGNIAEYLKKSH